MWKKLGKILLFMLILFINHHIVFAQDTTSELKKEIDELKHKQNILSEDIRLIKNILLKNLGNTQKPSLPTVNVIDVEFELGNNPEKGIESAPLVLVEFSDYQCSYCKKHSIETYPHIQENFINTGKLRYVFIDNPLPNHSFATKAAESAHCAAEQNRFAEMHQKIMESSPKSIDDLLSLALSLNIDMQKFKRCIESNKYANKVASNLSLAKRLNILNAPGFVLASSNPDNPKKVKGISFIRGARPFVQFKAQIDEALNNLSK